MRPTIEYIERKFEEFNQQMFAGELPKIPIELSNAKTFLGKCVYRSRKGEDGKVEKYDFRLKINTRIDLPEQDVEDTIIHEMIHYFIGYKKLEDSTSHGPIFLHIMNAINEKYGRSLTVSHVGTDEQNEEAYDKRHHWHVVAVVRFKDGKLGIKVLPRVIPKILNYYNAAQQHSGILSIVLYMTSEIFFNRYPCSSSLKVHYLDEDIIMGHLSDAEILECDGKVIKSR